MSPFYDYYCADCKHSQEEQFTMASKPEAVTCSNCGKTAHFQLSPVGFTVNGANAANRYSGDSNYRWKGLEGSEE